jgi:DHA2 family multidrug resistance protein
MQVLLDRGEELDWFGSGEIIIEAIIAASAFYLFPRPHLHRAPSRS